MKNKLLSVYAQADPATIQEGRVWYPTARASLVGLKHNSTFSEIQINGAAAALSVGTQWEQTLRNTLTLMQDKSACVGVSPQQRLKAIKILHIPNPPSYAYIYKTLGETAFKTKAFFRNLLGETDTVAVDRHILRAMGKEDIRIRTIAQYMTLENIVRQAAYKTDLNPAEFQAVIWLVQRTKEQ